jgi:hypothetical protein
VEENRVFVLGENNMFFFFGTFSIFQPSLRVRHEDMGSNFILYATDKVALEEGIYHALHFDVQVLKEVIKSCIMPNFFILVKWPK